MSGYETATRQRATAARHDPTLETASVERAYHSFTNYKCIIKHCQSKRKQIQTLSHTKRQQKQMQNGKYSTDVLPNDGTSWKIRVERRIQGSTALGLSFCFKVFSKCFVLQCE